MRRHLNHVEREEFLFGQIAACVVNFSMCRPKDGVQVRDFMPSQKDKQGKAVKSRNVRTHKEIRNEIMQGLQRLGMVTKR